MKLRRHWLALILLAIGALGGALANIAFRADAAASGSEADERQWEYCTITRAGYGAGASRAGVYWITYYRKAGPQVIDFEDNATSNAALAKAIARLGEEGWELTGVGPIDIRATKVDALYFKRPKR